MRLVFASANQHKMEEIKELLPPHLQVLGLKDVGITEDIPETGTTIRENAFIKADFVKHVLSRQNLPCMVFADDSGLEVEALNNAPGVYSARYAGEMKNDEANNQKLLNELKSTTKRQARFVTGIALLVNDGKHYFEGEVKGTIAYEARGEKGFGYDPLFIPQGYRSTFAELGLDLKNKISHRALAVKQLISYLTQNK